MIIASEFIIEAQISANKILGMNPMVFLAVLLAVIGVLFIIGRMYYLQWEHKAFLREVDGRILAVFHKKDGTEYNVFCEDYQGKVKVPKKNSSLIFGMPDSLKPPPGHTIDKYTVYPDHVWDSWYPERMPRNRQVPVKKINYYENVDHPFMPRNIEEWTADKYLKVSTSLFTQASNEATSEAALKKMSGYLKVIEDIVNKIGKLGIIFICGLASCGLIIVTGFIAYQAMSKADTIIKLIQAMQGIPIK